MTTQIWEQDRVQTITETQASWLEEQKLIWLCHENDCGDYHLETGVIWDMIDKALNRA